MFVNILPHTPRRTILNYRNVGVLYLHKLKSLQQLNKEYEHAEDLPGSTCVVTFSLT